MTLKTEDILLEEGIFHLFKLLCVYHVLNSENQDISPMSELQLNLKNGSAEIFTYINNEKVYMSIPKSAWKYRLSQIPKILN